MKTQFLFFLCCLLSLQFVQAQDILTKRTGEKVQAKVLEIAPNEIRYKLYTNLEGPTYVIPKAEVMLIQYPDNTSEAFELPAVVPANATASTETGALAPAIAPVPAATPLQLYAQGQSDAVMHYDGYKAAGTAVLITSLISPVIALVPAIGTSVSSPKQQNLDAPNNELLQQPDYASGYRKSARKIKSGKVWKNWAIGLGANILLIMLVSNG